MAQLRWQLPQAEPLDIARSYTGLARKVQGVIAIWALVQEATLHLYTLIKEIPEAERAIYQAELETRLLWPDAPISFRVIRDGDLPPEEIKSLQNEGERLL